MKQLLIILFVVQLVNTTIKELNSTYTFTISRPAEAQEAIPSDPCGLEVVECSGEGYVSENKAQDAINIETNLIGVKLANKQRIIEIAQDRGFEEVDNLLRLAYCESGFNHLAVNKNTDKVKSTDRGIVQYNDYWHPEVKNPFDVDESINRAIDMLEQGQLKQWMCSGVYYNTKYKTL